MTATLSAPMTLLRNADVYAPEPLGLQDLLLAGGSIVAMAPSLSTPLDDYDVRIVDLEGQRLLPGLIDCHVHLTGGGGESGPESRVPPVALTQLTRAGVTTAIGLLGTDGTTRSIADLVTAARGLCAYGFTAYCYTGSYQIPPPTLLGTVREDLVLIERIVGIGEIAISDHRSSQPTLTEIVKLAADAHVSGLMTGKAGVLHLHVGDGKRGLSLIREALDTTEIPSRTFHPTHCNRNPRLWEEVKSMTDYGVTFDVTAFPPDNESVYVTDAISQWLDEGLPSEQLTVSSDGGGCLPCFDEQGEMLHMDVGTSECLAITLRELQERGYALETVLPFFTSNVAHKFRFHRKGRLAVGQDADLLVLNETHHVQDVWCRGRRMVIDGEAVVRGLYE